MYNGSSTPSILCIAYSTQCNGEPGADPRGDWGKHGKPHTCTHTHTTDNVETAISQAHIFGLGKETPKAWEKHANSMDTGWRWNSNPLIHAVIQSNQPVMWQWAQMGTVSLKSHLESNVSSDWSHQQDVMTHRTAAYWMSFIFLFSFVLSEREEIISL